MVSWQKITIAFLLMATLLVLAFSFYAKNDKADELCKGFEVEVVPVGKQKFISEQAISQIIGSNGMDPKGKNPKGIKIDEIRNRLQKIAGIKKAKCYFTKSNYLKIEIVQREPFFKIMGNNNYFVDLDREIVENSYVFSKYVPIASGTITKEFASTYLYDFVEHIVEDVFLNEMIEQIHVLPNQEVNIVPLVGDQIIFVGGIKNENYKLRLDRLKQFYQKKVLDKMGWNTYSTIDLRFDNQIVCKKKKSV